MCSEAVSDESPRLNDPVTFTETRFESISLLTEVVQRVTGDQADRSLTTFPFDPEQNADQLSISLRLFSKKSVRR